VATFASAHCQLTASKLFASAPASVMPLLARNTRLDMIDYFSVGSSTASKNAMQGQSRITALTPMSLSAVVTGSSECQLALLPMRSDTALVYIETVRTPAPDSRVKVYDRNWKPLAAATFTQPELSAWLTKEGKKNAGMVAGLVPFMLASAEYSPETATLTLTNRLAEFLSDDVYKSIEPYLLTELVYRWDSSRFTLSK
jgi:hypothetical protein